MRVIVEAVSGPGKGRVISLKQGSLMVVGRTEWSDVCISADQQMSARHFALESGAGGLKLVDQGSTNGTQVNGEFVKEAPLYDGDQIMAGTTTFRVRVEESSPAPTSSEGGASPVIVGNSATTPDMPTPVVGTPEPFSPFGNSPIGNNDTPGPGQGYGSPIMQPADVDPNGPISWDEGPTVAENPSQDAPISQPSNPIGASADNADYNSPIIMPGESNEPAAEPFTTESPIVSGDVDAEVPPESSTDPSSPIEYAAPESPSPVSTPTPDYLEPPASVPPSSPPPAGAPPANVSPIGASPTSDPPTSNPPGPSASPLPHLVTPAPPPSDYAAVPVGQPTEERKEAVLDSTRNVKAASPEVLQYSVHPCKVETIKCLRSSYGDAEVEFAPSMIMSILRRHLPLVTIMHFQKGDLEYPADLTESTPLLHWLPEETARNYGPVMVPPTQQLDRFGTADALWDKDGLICVYARDIHGAMKHLVELVKYNMSGPNDQEGIFGYCWPSVLSALLLNQDEKIVDLIFSGILDCVFMEVPGEPGNWQMFGTDAHVSLLNQNGFTEIPLPGGEDEAAADQ